MAFDWTPVSLGVGLLGSLWSSKKSAEAAQASYDFQREVLQNRTQWAVEDMKKAGLNPILAAGGASGVGTGAMPTYENPGAAAMNSAMAARQIRSIDQQYRLSEREQLNRDKIAESQVMLNSAKAEKERADAFESGKRVVLYPEQASLFRSQVGVAEATAKNLSFSSQKLREETRYISGQIQLLGSQLRKYDAEIATLREQVRTAKTQQAKNMAEAALSTAQKSHQYLLSEGQQLINAGMVIENQAKEIGLRDSRDVYELNSIRRGLERRYYSAPLTPYIHGVGMGAKQLSPLIK